MWFSLGPGKFWKISGGLLLAAGMLAAAACNRGEEGSRSPVVHRGDLVSVSNRDFDYVEGDLVDCKNVSVVFLKGDIRGEKGRGIHVETMRGNVVSGQAKIDILEGNIIDGSLVTVRVLLGEDLSHRARVLDRTAAPRTSF